MNETDSFYQLDPQLVMLTAEKAGFTPTGEFSQLNSYENRVFDLRLESPELPRVIAKFYRPGRWSQEAILEEHDFLFELADEEVPVVPPLILENGSTVDLVHNMYVSFFPKFMGKMPDELFPKNLHSIGRTLAQLHNVGAKSEFSERPVLGVKPISASENLDLLSRWVTPELWLRYEAAASRIIHKMEDDLGDLPFIRIHGDCHRGNLLLAKNELQVEEFYFVDFDDCGMGPEIQDFWMLLSGDDSVENDMLLKGYTELRHFDESQFDAILALRGYRIFSYAAWIARRWKDPSFPKLFPEFDTYNYWAQEVEALEKIAWL